MIPVSEIYGPVVQGEGPVIGMPTVFVRTGGCDFRCAWCDTMFAVDPKHSATWKRMSPAAIYQRVRELAPNGGGVNALVTFSGGNPAMHRELGQVVEDLRHSDYETACETQGSIAQDWFAKLDHLIISPKPPSSGNVTDPEAVAACCQAAAKVDDGPLPMVYLKIAVRDEADLDYAAQFRDAFDELPLFLQPVNTEFPDTARSSLAAQVSDTLRERLRDLAWLNEQVLARGWYDVHVLPQLHVLTYGNERGR